MHGKKNRGADNGAKSGYRPLNEGYSPVEKRGYIGKDSALPLPKAPQGGTGKTTANGAKTESRGGKK